MELFEIVNIRKKDIPLFYRNEYLAVASFKVMNDKIAAVDIEFVVEMSPIGEKLITVAIAGKPDYPTLPMIKILKEEIRTLEQNGGLH